MYVIQPTLASNPPTRPEPPETPSLRAINGVAMASAAAPESRS